MSAQRCDPPAYFEPIRQASAQRWNQLDGDPELAGPWLQLFKQVQNPRNVLSELLQNADDAGASEAIAQIEDGVFLFEHDGEDFREEQFRSLCRFGYSNKRNLHTIGFRGIGFKSTFSLGDTVEVHSPTLSVCFQRRRFTEPHWLGERSSSAGKTRIRVAIEDDQRRRQLEENFEEWRRSSLSLLFFKNLRRLQVGGVHVGWHHVGDGPVPNSEYLQLGESQDPPFLIVRSAPEPFPAEALDEIRQERMVADDEGMNFPPATIEIVMGPKKGGLYVVLPAGVETPLPFACNAPFIQDPARLKIKDPSTSPTNRWLLERAGRLAASAMLGSLRQLRAPYAERATAYDLLPDVDRTDTSLSGTCGKLVELAFETAVQGERLVFTDTGALVETDQAIAFPPEVLEVWPTQHAAELFDDRERAALSRHISVPNRQKLLNWGWVEEIKKQQVIDGLRKWRAPRPQTWEKLLALWAYVAPEVNHPWSDVGMLLCIIPVKGKAHLYTSLDTVRLPDRKLTESEEDWNFLANYLLVTEQEWFAFLAEYQRLAQERSDSDAAVIGQVAESMLAKFGLARATSFSHMISRVAAGLVKSEEPDITSWVRLAHLAAKAKATADGNFRYVTRDGQLRERSHDVFAFFNGHREDIIPTARHDAHLLHEQYNLNFTSCSSEDWWNWVENTDSGVSAFPRLVMQEIVVWGRDNIVREAARRGYLWGLNYAYVTSDFRIEDWDFEKDYWKYWKEESERYSNFWGELLERFFELDNSFWHEAHYARIIQVSTRNSGAYITNSELLPSWILRLRELPCLRTTRDVFDKPGNLLRLVPATRAVIGVEEFVHDSIDIPANHALLDLLGVRITPTGPDRLLERVRALASSASPPVHELDKWYRQLDQMMATCQPPDAKKIKDAFQAEKLILTENDEWVTAGAVFRSLGDDDIPGTTIVRPSVASLALWQKVGVAERPTVDLVIDWLKTLPSGRELAPGDLARVEGVLERHGTRIWVECGHWLNLSDEWVQTTTLRFVLTRQTLAWAHLHDWVKQQTADLRRVPATVAVQEPFSALPLLATQFQDRLVAVPQTQGHPSERPWFTTFATELCRFVGTDDDETTRVRDLARRALATRWHQVADLQMAPYIDGVPAGRARSVDVLWSEQRFYARSGLARAKLAKCVPEEIARPFRIPEIKAALDYSFERSPEDIRDYLNENMKLGDHDDIENPPSIDVEEIDDTDSERHGGTGATVFIVKPPDSSGERDDLDDLEQLGDDDDPDAGLNPDAGLPTKRAKKPSELRPSLIERFAVALGYEKESVDRYFNARDGSWIAKTKNDRFPWVRMTSSGDIARYYWPREQCLGATPLELEADLWLLLDSKPTQYALILVDVHGTPIEHTGSALRRLVDERRLNLYPANYRLVMENQ